MALIQTTLCIRGHALHDGRHKLVGLFLSGCELTTPSMDQSPLQMIPAALYAQQQYRVQRRTEANGRPAVE